MAKYALIKAPTNLQMIFPIPSDLSGTRYGWAVYCCTVGTDISDTTPLPTAVPPSRRTQNLHHLIHFRTAHDTRFTRVHTPIFTIMPFLLHYLFAQFAFIKRKDTLYITVPHHCLQRYNAILPVTCTAAGHGDDFATKHSSGLPDSMDSKRSYLARQEDA